MDAAAGAQQPRRAVRAGDRRAAGAQHRDAASDQNADHSDRDQDRRRGGRPVGAAVGELENERERIQRRAVAPVVDRAPAWAASFGADAGERQQPERAGEQRR